MILLIWLYHFDKRWSCSLTCPIIQSMWLFCTFYCIIIASLNIYSVYFHGNCVFAQIHLLINSLLLSIIGVLSYIIYQKTYLKQEKLLQFQNRQDIILRINHWIVRKALLSKIGVAIILLGIIQIIWGFKVYLNFDQCDQCQEMQPSILQLNLILITIATIPIIFIIVCYIIIKTTVLITSSLFPNIYIKIRRIFCK